LGGGIGSRDGGGEKSLFAKGKSTERNPEFFSTSISEGGGRKKRKRKSATRGKGEEKNLSNKKKGKRYFPKVKKKILFSKPDP